MARKCRWEQEEEGRETLIPAFAVRYGHAPLIIAVLFIIIIIIIITIMLHIRTWRVLCCESCLSS